MEQLEKEQRFVLSLSGGGFRASLFHIGVVRRLVYLGLFDRVVRINSVSGGSIIAGLLMKELTLRGSFKGVQDYDERIIKPFVDFVQKSPRHRLSWKVFRVGPNKFSDYLAKELYGDLSFNKLTKSPFWCCFSTSLDSGKQWRFSQTQIGETEIGFSDPLDADKIAVGVAASACFQPYFKPMELDLSDRQWVRSHVGGKKIKEVNKSAPKKVHLSDGGVYDNLAVQSVLNTDDFLIVSDASADTPYWRYGAPKIPFSKVKRPVDVALGQLNNLTRLLVFNRSALSKDFAMIENVKQLSQYTHFTPEGLVPPTPAAEMPKYEQLNNNLEAALGRIRTDLNAFHDAEIHLLIWSGMAKIDAVLKRWAPQIMNIVYKEDVPPLHLDNQDVIINIINRRSKFLSKILPHKQLHFHGKPKFRDEITMRLGGEVTALSNVAATKSWID